MGELQNLRKWFYAASIFILWSCIVAANMAWASIPQVCRAPVSEKELLILNPAVLDQKISEGFYNPWSLNYIFESLAGQGRGEALLKSFVDAWSLSDERGFLLRGLHWYQITQSRFRFDEAPFSASAIVYHNDINELRFVFGGRDSKNGSNVPVTLIFEYALSSDARLNWPKLFHQLGDIPWGPSYNAALKETLAFALENAKFLRLRTNDHILSQHWQMREFILNNKGQFQINVLENTPRTNLNSVEKKRIIDWAKKYSKNSVLPRELLTDVDVVKSEDRDLYSSFDIDANTKDDLEKATCGGCHTKSTGARFQHIFPRQSGRVAQISDFLKAEVQTRAKLLQNQVCSQ